MNHNEIEACVIKAKNGSKALRQAMNKLSKEEREILIMIYCKDIPLKTYAQNNKLSYQ